MIAVGVCALRNSEAKNNRSGQPGESTARTQPAAKTFGPDQACRTRERVWEPTDANNSGRSCVLIRTGAGRLGTGGQGGRDSDGMGCRVVGGGGTSAYVVDALWPTRAKRY